MSRPNIYCFSTHVSGGRGLAIALAASGSTLAAVTVDDERNIPSVMSFSQQMHADFASHYPGGYNLVYVTSRERETHAGLQNAIGLHNGRTADNDRHMAERESNPPKDGL